METLESRMMQSRRVAVFGPPLIYGVMIVGENDTEVIPNEMIAESLATIKALTASGRLTPHRNNAEDWGVWMPTHKPQSLGHAAVPHRFNSACAGGDVAAPPSGDSQ